MAAKGYDYVETFAPHSHKLRVHACLFKLNPENALRSANPILNLGPGAIIPHPGAGHPTVGTQAEEAPGAPSVEEGGHTDAYAAGTVAATPTAGDDQTHIGGANEAPADEGLPEKPKGADAPAKMASKSVTLKRRGRRPATRKK
jgi:hypothetical protein